ncbi:MAG: hypothetical protein Q8N26_22190 [Myxococcales bacterium]|nr:hypothetical protein [Myxococcales bacterium]
MPTASGQRMRRKTPTFEEVQLGRVLVSPRFTSAADEVTRRCARGQTPVFEDEDLFAGGAAQEAAEQPAHRPADAVVGLAEVQQVLLGLVRRHHDGAFFRERALRARLEMAQAAERRQPGAGERPFFCRLELRLNRLGHSPAIGEPELGQHGAGRGGPEAVDEVLAQQPHRDGVDEQRPLASELNEAFGGVELEELVVV